MTAIAACRTCGTEPLKNARFCHSCGLPVDDGDTRAEYKQVTVLFADVVRSMDIASAVGAERLREIMTELVTRCTAVVLRYGGTVDKFTGDGIMAVFGAPTALEYHAFRACLAALDMQAETAELAKTVEASDGIALQLRVGLNSGQVIAGEIGSGPSGYTAIGEQVGMAQRLLAALRQLETMMTKLESECGFSPVSRSRLGFAEVGRVSKVDELIARRQRWIDQHHRTREHDLDYGIDL